MAPTTEVELVLTLLDAADADVADADMAVTVDGTVAGTMNTLKLQFLRQ